MVLACLRRKRSEQEVPTLPNGLSHLPAKVALLRANAASVVELRDTVAWLSRLLGELGGLPDEDFRPILRTVSASLCMEAELQPPPPIRGGSKTAPVAVAATADDDDDDDDDDEFYDAPMDTATLDVPTAAVIEEHECTAEQRAKLAELRAMIDAEPPDALCSAHISHMP